jgi:hypothetical protein
MLIKELKKNDKWHCNKCDYVTKASTGIQNHYKLHDENMIPNKICVTCNKEFYHKNPKRKNCDKHKGTGEKDQSRYGINKHPDLRKVAKTIIIEEANIIISNPCRCNIIAKNKLYGKIRKNWDDETIGKRSLNGIIHSIFVQTSWIDKYNSNCVIFDLEEFKEIHNETNS